MNGIYRLYGTTSVGPSTDEKSIIKQALANPRMAAIIRSLTADGLRYSVSVEAHPQPSVVVRAHGTPTKRRKCAGTRRFAAPKPLTSEQIEKQLSKAVQSEELCRSRLKDHLREQSQDGIWPAPRYDCKRAERQRKVGRAVARIIARHHSRDPYHFSNQDYTEADAACGTRVQRASQLGKYDREQPYLAYIVKYFGFSSREFEPRPRISAEEGKTAHRYDYVGAYLEAKAEVEFWRECELLSGQREFFQNHPEYEVSWKIGRSARL